MVPFDEGGLKKKHLGRGEDSRPAGVRRPHVGPSNGTLDPRVGKNPRLYLHPHNMLEEIEGFKRLSDSAALLAGGKGLKKAYGKIEGHRKNRDGLISTPLYEPRAATDPLKQSRGGLPSQCLSHHS